MTNDRREVSSGVSALGHSASQGCLGAGVPRGVLGLCPCRPTAAVAQGCFAVRMKQIFPLPVAYCTGKKQCLILH